MFQDKVIVITGGANGIGKCIEYIAAHDAWRASVMKGDSGIPAEQIDRQKEE